MGREAPGVIPLAKKGHVMQQRLTGGRIRFLRRQRWKLGQKQNTSEKKKLFTLSKCANSGYIPPHSANSITKQLKYKTML